MKLAAQNVVSMELSYLMLPWVKTAVNVMLAGEDLFVISLAALEWVRIVLVMEIVTKGPTPVTATQDGLEMLILF